MSDTQPDTPLHVGRLPPTQLPLVVSHMKAAVPLAEKPTAQVNVHVSPCTPAVPQLLPSVTLLGPASVAHGVAAQIHEQQAWQ